MRNYDDIEAIADSLTDDITAGNGLKKTSRPKSKVSPYDDNAEYSPIIDSFFAGSNHAVYDTPIPSPILRPDGTRVKSVTLLETMGAKVYSHALRDVKGSQPKKPEPKPEQKPNTPKPTFGPRPRRLEL